MSRAGAWPLVLLAALLTAMPLQAPAQNTLDTLVVRALELEGSGQPRYAAPLYRRALAGEDPVPALLGLERVYAELGMTDSLLTPLGSVVGRLPADPTVRTVQLRTLHTLQRDGALHEAVRAWARAAPGDPSPYRELARLLLADGRADAADSVITAARRALGGTTPLAQEIARVRAARGAWEQSAEAWRAALASEPWLGEAAAYALGPTPAGRREAVRAAFMMPPVDAAARLALAALESRWGSTERAWDALRELPADSAAAAAWIAFAETAEAQGRWVQARAAYESALRWRASDRLRLRAAEAAFSAGDAAAAILLAPMPTVGVDSQQVARELVPLHVMALGSLRRAADAERLVTAFDRYLAPGLRTAMARAVANAWVRSGDLARARAALAAAGEDADSSAAAGWIALYEGNADAARAVLGRGEERTADAALALAVLARFREPRAPEVGRAFLTLAQRDTAAAARQFVAAAARVPAAASLLMLTAAQLHMDAGETAAAVGMWARIVAAHPGSAEAPQALLHSGRALLARGERAAAIERLEHLVLSYPASALVPVARRELELARQADPSSAPRP